MRQWYNFLNPLNSRNRKTMFFRYTFKDYLSEDTVHGPRSLRLQNRWFMRSCIQMAARQFGPRHIHHPWFICRSLGIRASSPTSATQLREPSGSSVCGSWSHELHPRCPLFQTFKILFRIVFGINEQSLFGKCFESGSLYSNNNPWLKYHGHSMIL